MRPPAVDLLSWVLSKLDWFSQHLAWFLRHGSKQLDCGTWATMRSIIESDNVYSFLRTFPYFNGCYPWMAYLVQFEHDLDFTAFHKVNFGKRRFEVLQPLMSIDEDGQSTIFCTDDMSLEERRAAAEGASAARDLGEPISMRVIQGHKNKLNPIPARTYRQITEGADRLLPTLIHKTSFASPV